MFPLWAPLAVLLVNAAYLLWRRPAPHVEVPVLCTCLAVFLARFLPLIPVTGFAVGAFAGYYLYLVRGRARSLPDAPSPRLAALMEGLAVLMIAHHTQQIAEDAFHREYEASLNAFEAEGYDVLVHVESEGDGREGEIAVRVFVHKRAR